MLQINSYDVYVFDCDGVILDSNQLKIDAMEKALSNLFTDRVAIDKCILSFKHNFGKSRFYHVDVFLSDFLIVPEDNKIKCKDDIIQLYSSMCKKLYLEADITPGFLSFINSLSGKKYIASGSEQEELRSVFLQRGLDSYFDRIYGSPVAKKDNVKTILEIESTKNAIMFGDAISDLDSAYTNSINFCAYIPFSNVPVELTEKSNKYNFPVINSWAELGLK